MRDLKQRLVDGDPMARDGGLTPADAEVMRRLVLLEADRRPLEWSPPEWPRQRFAALAVFASLVLAVAIAVRMDMRPREPATVRTAEASRDAHRQLQFVAPGGTRIIWTFRENVDF